MLAKLTSQNRVTLPKSVMADFPGTKYFDVSSEDIRTQVGGERMGGLDASPQH